MAEADTSTKFYCYAHRTADDGKIFYIGKGHGNRAYSKQRSKYWHNKVNKHGYVVEMIASGLSELNAFAMEREFIAFYGRENLVNLTDGGDGSSGYLFTEDDRKKMSESAKKYFSNKNVIEMLSATKKERIKNNENEMKRMSELAKNQWLNEKTRSNLLEKRFIQIGNIETHPRVKKIVCIEKNITFIAMKLARDWLISNGFLKATISGITQCAKGKYKKAYGYTWKYSE